MGFSRFIKLYNSDAASSPITICPLAVGCPVFDCIEAYAPGFKSTVVGRDILTPPDLERIFGLPGGVSRGVSCHNLLSAPSLFCKYSGFYLSFSTQNTYTKSKTNKKNIRFSYL